MYTYPKQYLYKRIVQAKVFIDNHFSEDIDLENIADEALFSKFHFMRLFKSIYGSTPHQYLTRLRVDQAKSLLESNTTVSDVCFKVGFNSTSTFTGFFRKNVGCTPSDFQKKARVNSILTKAQPLMRVPNCFATQYGWKKE